MVRLFIQKIKAVQPIDEELVKVENFNIAYKHACLYAQFTSKGVYINAEVTSGEYGTYCIHTLHEYWYECALDDSNDIIEARVMRLLQKTLAQLIILEPIQIECVREGKDYIL